MAVRSLSKFPSSTSAVVISLPYQCSALMKIAAFSPGIISRSEKFSNQQINLFSDSVWENDERSNNSNGEILEFEHKIVLTAACNGSL